jgi:C-terminal peptidase prc
VVRDRIEIESVHGWRQIGVDGRGRPVWDWIVDPEAAIAFVSIREFDGDTDRLFREAMREADRALGPDRLVQGLILDLRENPGGDRTSTERLLDLFINDGDVFRAAGELPIKSSTRATIASTRLAGLPVVVLVSGHSASASELVAGTLQGTADALVVGDRTFGKGSVQGVHPVRHGYMLVTESWFLVPTGSNGAWRPIDRARANEWGVTPTIHVPTPASELQDALAERGEWVSQLGRDVEGRPVASVSLEETTDRGLLTAVLLLRARLLPTIIGSDAAQ